MRRKKARGSIENLGEPDLWRDIDLNDIGDLDRVYQNALRVTSQKSSIEDEIKRLRQGLKKGNGDPLKLQEGIVSLSGWLKEQNGGRKSALFFLALPSLRVLLLSQAHSFWVNQ